MWKWDLGDGGWTVAPCRMNDGGHGGGYSRNAAESGHAIGGIDVPPVIMGAASSVPATRVAR